MPRVISFAFVLLAVAALCAADSPAKQPTTAPAEPQDAKPDSTGAPASGGKVTVAAVTGLAQKCDASQEPVEWKPLKVGDELGEKAIIRTGLSSSVVLKFEDRSDVRVGSVTKVGISEFRKDGAKVKTRLGLKYGSVRAHVHSERGPADFRVTTATATLSVRGSILDGSFTADLGSQGRSLQGLLILTSALRQQMIQKGEGITDDHNLPVLAMLSQFHAQIGDKSGGLTPSEIKSLLTNGGGRAGIGGSVPGNQSGTGPGTFTPTSLVQGAGNTGPGNQQNPGWP